MVGAQRYPEHGSEEDQYLLLSGADWDFMILL
jgi:hypothetical protein